LVSATTLGDEKYTYDGSGNIIKKSINGQVTKMSYDASNKVTAISSPSKGNEQVNYDAAGRPVSYKDASGQVTRELSYGYADKVLRADNNGSKAEFFYNAEGQLVGKAVGGITTAYSWDGNVLAPQGENSFTNEDHISGGVPILTDSQELVVSDYLGNTLSQGISQFNSTAYGEGLEQGRFTGKAFVKNLGGYVFHHRLLSSDLNRWNTVDPSGYPDGSNNYLYTNNEPTQYVDPLGPYKKTAVDHFYGTATSPDGIHSASVTLELTTKYGIAAVFSLNSATATLDAPANKQESEVKYTIGGRDLSHRNNISVDVTGLQNLHNISCTISGQFSTTVEK
jgi:RHS repeat-associated protein